MTSVAIIDTVGLIYDGDSLLKKGLGGSESAVILMSKELQKIGFEVTVFNNCISKDSKQGVFDGVVYTDISQLNEFNDYTFDIVISSRSFSPFSDQKYWDGNHKFHPSLFEKIKKNASWKVVWMHDTFCWGDQLLEEHLVNGHIDEIFTLSDFHTVYVTNCDHGNRRNFEVLKNKVFITRNGAVNYKPEVDITKKDRNLFVYNASVTKGMIPLIEEIWPKVKQQLPDARLKIIGGFYKFKDEDGPDEQENKFWQLYKRENNKELNIEFTGIIKQSEIAEILSQASFFIFPGAFPETFGISSLESLLYNTPIITTRFGALEETAIQNSCYHIDYAIEPNSLFTNIDKQAQVERFVNLVCYAYRNTYLHQQKMYNCNIVKDIAGWDTVALQWKQHLYKVLKLSLNVNDYRNVKSINYKVHKIFGRRFSNNEEWVVPKLPDEQSIKIISPFYNAENYIEKCILSVAAQDYSNYKHYLIDDNSTDNSFYVAQKVIQSLPENIRSNFIVSKNWENKGAVYNQINRIRHFDSEDIIMLLDGDDWLYPEPDIFDYYNELFANNNAEYSYGSCWSVVDNIPLISQPYPEKVKKEKNYRNHKFNWGIPYTHLRVFRKKLLNGIPDSVFKDVEGNWFKAGGDVSTFYNILEQADPNKVKTVSRIVYCYNDANPLNDYKVNSNEQTKNAAIAGKKMNKFSFIIPTMWRCKSLFQKTLTDLVDNKHVGEIIIIVNDTENTPLEWDVLKHSKIKLYPQDRNIKVNPAWNLGVRESKNDLICLLNDDIWFDMKLLDILVDRISENDGAYGMITGEAHFNHPLSTDFSISIKEWEYGENIHGFGQMMFLHKKNWEPIIDGLEIYFGDDFIFHNQLKNKRKNYLIYNIRFESPMAATSSDRSLVEGFLEKERPIYLKWTEEQPILKIENKMKTILIAIPTSKYIEPETFKSIYDLEIPEGYKTHFQYFYGYNVEQIRNLIAHWAEKFDYLFSVDSDITFSTDTLQKLLNHNKDIVSGLYIQRKPNEQIIELYRNGKNIPYSELKNKGLVEVESCGFGCVLINSQVIRDIGYPQFVYKSTLDHKNAISEDTYFCLKAREKGYHVYADTSILCGHIGSNVFEIQDIPEVEVIQEDSVIKRLRELSKMSLMPQKHYEYLKTLNIKPKVIYDIGACVLHWTSMAKHIWPDARYVAFEAVPECRIIFEENNIKDYKIGVLSDRDGKLVEFYENKMDPGGNSYFKENENFNKKANELYNDNNKVLKITQTLDSVVDQNSFPLPDLIKMDIQGAEMDVLKGAQQTLKHCKDLIVELQKVEYNKGAPLKEEVISFIESLGFKLVLGPFCDNGPDGDYHFTRI